MSDNDLLLIQVEYSELRIKLKFSYVSCVMTGMKRIIIIKNNKPSLQLIPSSFYLIRLVEYF